MAGRQDFTTEEWKALGHAQLAAGFIVASSTGGSRRDFNDEMYAVLEELRDRSVIAGSQLVREIAGEDSGLGGESIDEWRSESEADLLASLRRAVALVSKRAPDELAAFREHLVAVAERAARATKHGGFLGIGGRRVNEKERAVLDKVSEAVGAV